MRVLAEELPFVTLLLRVRGNSEVERAALHRRREFDRLVTALVRAAEAEGDVRPDVDPAVTSRLLFGTVNSLTEWYRPDGGLTPDDARRRADRHRLPGTARPGRPSAVSPRRCWGAQPEPVLGAVT